MISLILSGGVGSRLWPLSREKLPKQFSPLFEKSLFHATVDRLAKLGEVRVCTGAGLRHLTETSIRDNSLAVEKVYYEPVGRNTAPAIALVCKALSDEAKLDEILGVFPSDHWVENEDEFKKVIDLAELCAEKDQIVTLGIKPDHPATGFGYVETETQSFLNHGDVTAYAVKGFREKPDRATAQEFLTAGNFFWNSGMFVFKVSKMIEAFEQHMPELWQGISQLKSDLSNIDEVFPKLPAQSIDYGVMEKVKSQVNIPAQFGWSDLGSWDDVADIAKTRELHNPSQVLSHKSKDCFAYSDTGKTVSFSEVDGIIAVDTQDALLITKKGSSQSVKEVVEQLKNANSNLVSDHVFENRPWGEFRNIWDAPDFKTKVIKVSPKQQLSYQSHQKRAEIWIVVQGEGEVVLNEEVLPVKKGSHLTIPQQAKHRMRNTGTEELIFVEVQLGEYFGEDDITRFEDDYQRV